MPPNKRFSVHKVCECSQFKVLLAPGASPGDRWSVTEWPPPADQPLDKRLDVERDQPSVHADRDQPSVYVESEYSVGEGSSVSC